MKLADYAHKSNQDNSPYSIEYLPPEAMDPGIAWYHIDLVHTTKPQQEGQPGKPTVKPQKQPGQASELDLGANTGNDRHSMSDKIYS